MAQKCLQSPKERLHGGILFDRTLSLKRDAGQRSGNYQPERMTSSADKIIEAELTTHSYSDGNYRMIESAMKNRRHHLRNPATDAMLLSSVSPSLRVMKRSHVQFACPDLEPPVTKRRFQRRNSATAAMLIAGLGLRNQQPSSFLFDSSRGDVQRECGKPLPEGKGN